MKRVQLEHLIRACTQIADDDELIVIGSQAILGQFPDAPASLLVSGREKDLLFAEEAARHGLVAVPTLTERLHVTPVSADLRPHVEQRLQRLAALR